MREPVDRPTGKHRQHQMVARQPAKAGRLEPPPSPLRQHMDVAEREIGRAQERDWACWPQGNIAQDQECRPQKDAGSQCGRPARGCPVAKDHHKVHEQNRAPEIDPGRRIEPGDRSQADRRDPGLRVPAWQCPEDRDREEPSGDQQQDLRPHETPSNIPRSASMKRARPVRLTWPGSAKR